MACGSQLLQPAYVIGVARASGDRSIKIDVLVVSMRLRSTGGAA
jgi:hypothetical protein